MKCDLCGSDMMPSQTWSSSNTDDVWPYNCTNYLCRNTILVDNPPLSKQELVDIKASLKEIAEGKYKRFDNIEDFLKDLHEARTEAEKT